MNASLGKRPDLVHEEGVGREDLSIDDGFPDVMSLIRTRRGDDVPLRWGDRAEPPVGGPSSLGGSVRCRPFEGIS